MKKLTEKNKENPKQIMLELPVFKTAPFLLCLILAVTPLRAKISVAHDDNEEYALKATFLYRCSDYIEWNYYKPDLFSIAILGQSPIAAPLLEIARAKKVKNRKISITSYSDLEAIDFCNILFIPFDCPVPLETILARFSHKEVLIVTEKPGYGKQGAHLNFFLEDNRLKFEINAKAISRSNMTVSAFLLQHAVIVE